MAQGITTQRHSDPKCGNRSWALSVVLTHIDADEFGRIMGLLTVPEIDRFSATCEGYGPDIILRDNATHEAPNV